MVDKPDYWLSKGSGMADRTQVLLWCILEICSATFGDHWAHSIGSRWISGRRWTEGFYRLHGRF